MKYSIHLLAILLLCIASSNLSAQDNWEESVYLKNGSIYRGTIIEQIPGVSVNIETRDRNVIHINMADVERMTKTRIEPPIAPPPPPAPPRDMDYHDREIHHSGEGHHDRLDEAHLRPYYQAKRGYFGQANLNLGLNQVGIRVINGFRFNRFAQLGVGVGIDFYRFSNNSFGFNDNSYNGYNVANSRDGVYLPVFLHFTGELLNKRVTPFYAIEAGYGFHVSDQNSYYNYGNNKITGGMMGGAGFGVKFQSRHRFNFRISAVVNFQHNNASNAYSYQSYPYNYDGRRLAISPGIRLGFAF
jgi:hypothetical protein